MQHRVLLIIMPISAAKSFGLTLRKESGLHSVPLKMKKPKLVLSHKLLKVRLQRKVVSQRILPCLYRTNAQSRMIEEMLLRRSVHYRVVGGLKFYQRKEVKKMS